MERELAEKLLSDAKLEQRRKPPELEEMISIVESLAAEQDGFEVRAMLYLDQKGPSASGVRKIVALDTLSRFLERISANKDAVRRALGAGKK